MITVNTDLRLAIAEAGLSFSEVASELSISRSSLSRLLNNDDLRPSQRKKINDAIVRASEKKSEG